MLNLFPRKLIFLSLLCLVFGAAAFAQEPSGTFMFARDSDGATADEGAVFLLTFPTRGSGTADFVGVGAQSISDSGHYTISGGQVTLTLPGLGKNVSGSYTLVGNTLTLPFKLLSSGQGTSTWQRQPGQSGDTETAGGTSTPPPMGPGSGGGGSSGSGGGSGSGSGGGGGGGGGGKGSSGTGGPGSGGGGGGGGTGTTEPPPGPGPGPGPSGPSQPGPSGPSQPGPGQPTQPGPQQPGPKPRPKPQPTPEESKMSPYVGDWVGLGWGWEIRFRSSDVGTSGPSKDHNVMTLTVRHLTRFDFTVDKKGMVTGDAEITYDLDPNLCGVHRAAQQVNMMIDTVSNLNQALETMRGYGEKVNDIFGLKSEREAALLKSEIASWQKFKNATNDQKYGTKQSHSSMWENMGHKAEDTGDLAVSVWYERCSSGIPVTIVGGLGCDELLNGPPLTEPDEVKSVQAKLLEFLKEQGNDVKGEAWDKVKDDVKNALWNLDSNTLYNEMPRKFADAAKDALKEKTIKAFNVFGIQEQPAKDACAGIPSTRRAGTEINTPTMQSMMESWSETFKSMIQSGMTGDVTGTMASAANLMMNVPGVTKVQYNYKGLSKGPESRRFKVRGYIEGGKLFLFQDGEVRDGDKNLYVEYQVNMVSEKKPFPTWSPFIPDKGGDLKNGGMMQVLDREVVTCDQEDGANAKKTATAKKEPCKPRDELKVKEVKADGPFATFHETGEHREGKPMWHDYEYYWRAFQVTKPGNPTKQATTSTKKK